MSEYDPEEWRRKKDMKDRHKRLGNDEGFYQDGYVSYIVVIIIIMLIVIGIIFYASHNAP